MDVNQRSNPTFALDLRISFCINHAILVKSYRLPCTVFHGAHKNYFSTVHTVHVHPKSDDPKLTWLYLRVHMMQNTKLNTIIDTVVTSTVRNLMAKSVGWQSLHLVIVGPETLVSSITFGTYHGEEPTDNCESRQLWAVSGSGGCIFRTHEILIFRLTVARSVTLCVCVVLFLPPPTTMLYYGTTCFVLRSNPPVRPSHRPTDSATSCQRDVMFASKKAGNKGGENRARRGKSLRVREASDDQSESIYFLYFKFIFLLHWLHRG